MRTANHWQDGGRSNCGHLIRRLRLFESLIFERLGQRFAITLLSSQPPAQVGVALMAGEAGSSLVGIRCERGRQVRFDLCPSAGLDVLTVERDMGEPVTVACHGKPCLAVSAVRAAPRALGLRLDVPALGALTIEFTPERDAARLYVVADRSVRVFPSKHHYN